MKIAHKYTGTREYAHQQIDTLLTSLQKQYGDRISNPSTSWSKSGDRMDFSFGVYGFNLKGSVEIRDGEVVLDGSVPFFAKPFQGKAEELIRNKLEEIL